MKHSIVINNLIDIPITNEELSEFWKDTASFLKSRCGKAKIQSYRIESDDPSIDGIRGEFNTTIQSFKKRR